MEQGWAADRGIVVRWEQPGEGAAYLRAAHHQATKVEADDPATKSGVAGVAARNVGLRPWANSP